MKHREIDVMNGWQDLAVLGADDNLFDGYLQFYSAAVDRYEAAVGQIPGSSQKAATGTNLSWNSRLAMMYRVYKKMILWDVLLGLGKK